MLSLTYQGPWQLALVDREEPSIKGPNQVLIRVAATGICGTDLGIAAGHYTAAQGVVLGHEFSGTVVATSEDVKNVRPGDRVFVDPTFFCGQCDQCTSGRPNHCEEKSSTETGVSADGAFAPYHVTTSRFVVPMAPSTTFEAATLAEPFSCALTGVNQANVRPDDKTVVLGAGTMGLMYAHALGLKGVRGTIVDTSADRLALATRALPTGWNAAASFDEAITPFKNRRCDLVVDTTSAMTETALQHLNRGGKIILVGLRRHNARIDPAELADKSISLIGSIDSIGTFPMACRLIDQGRLPWQAIITHTTDLKDYAKAFSELGVELTARRVTPTARHIKILLTTCDPG
jgi:threonine dehydrogenase-like Zn-dependent dehydrogenase